MADREISMLPAVEAVTDETLLPVYQPGAQNPAQSMTGAQFRAFAEASVKDQTAAATLAAESAGKAAAQASLAADRAEETVKGYQPDWDQNDSEGKGYIRNRPFWREVTLLLEGEYRLEDDGTGNGRCEIGAGVLPIEAGKTYLVAFDGKEFVCTAYQSSAFGDIVNIGNAGVTTGASGEPFLLWTYPGVSDVLNTREPGTYQLRLYELSGYKQLDEVYIPDTIARSDDVPPAIVNAASGEVVAVNDSAERPLRGLTLYGKTVQNGTPSPDNPVPLESVGADGTMNVTVSGKNLFGFGVTAHDRTAEYREVAYQRLIVEPVGEGLNSLKYTFNNGNWSVAYICLDGIDGTKDYAYSWKVTNNTTTYSPYIRKDTVYSDESRLMLVIEGGNGSAFVENTHSFIMSDIQVEEGSVSTAYEPYKDGGSVTAQAPNGLPGIPVSSGGNYTDENGQQWICDEVDFARGKYVQRVLKAVLNGAEAWREMGVASGVTYKRWQTQVVGLKDYNNDTVFDGFVSHFSKSTASTAYGGGGLNSVAVQTQGYINVYTNHTSVDEFKAFLNANNVTFMCVLATPIETDLSNEELAQYAALHTNYPNTTVFNDSGAGMGVSYVADTKTYIDNKFAQLAAAMLNG